MQQKTKTSEVAPTNLPLLSLAALGIVFGDIGTSPLYTLKTVLTLLGNGQDVSAVLGSLSLIIWTLIIVTTVKYVNVAMRVDNDGEGGILALMSLLVGRKHRGHIVILGLMGAALIYGDGAITPAISVLSALEGLNIATPFFMPYILPGAVTILVLLFAIQSRGTALIGKAFGPIMALWFVTIGALGLWGIDQHPSVLAALNPMHGFQYLYANGMKGFLVLGGVFLCVTGAEALYADMGQFGAKPIRLAWSALVFPSLILNYAGQAAIVLDGAPVSDNIFYRLCPHALLIPLVILSTIATIIASQSIITGAFSMTRQAMQLGYLPRLRITQTSAEGYGQIYVSGVNWLLMIATIGLTVMFKKSDNLAAAYGIAVSATMLATSVLLFIAMREIWKWNWLKAGLLAGLFMIVDAGFFTSNLSKFTQGGYVPIIIATLIYSVMHIWHKGAQAVMERVKEKPVPIHTFMAHIANDKIARVPGTAVFLTRTHHNTPPVMIWHVKQNQSLHERVLILQVTSCTVPWVRDSKRLTLKETAGHVWRAEALYGFMERPHIPKILEHAVELGCKLTLDNITYYLGHETIISRMDKRGLPHWIVSIYAFLQRNCLHWSEYLELPSDYVMELGRQISI